MSTITRHSAVANDPATDPRTMHRFSVEDYHEMGRAGILGPEDRVELLEGWIVKKMNLNPPHMVCVKLCDAALTAAIPAQWHTRTQGPVTTEASEPEPDVAVVRGAVRDYLTKHPAGSDTALVVEVADSSLSNDRYKRAIYAQAGFPHYWIVDLTARHVEVYGEPIGGQDARYRKEQILKPGQEIPLVIDGAEIAMIPVAELLP